MNRIVLVVFMVVIAGLSSCSSEKESDNAEIKAELTALRSEVAQIKEAISDIHRIALRSNGGQGTQPKVDIAAPTLSLDWDTEFSLGDENAPIVMVEFADYECPFCARYHQQTFAAIKRDYIDTGKIRYVVKDYPLGFHPQAFDAAIAANCAAEQGAYLAMRAALFENYRQLSAQLYMTLAERNNMDLQQFEACTGSESQKKRVQDSATYGQQLAVNGTPHFFIGNVENQELVNVRRIAGAQPISSFSSIIDSM